MPNLGELVVLVALVVGGLGHLLPAVGVISNQQLERLYGFAVSEPDLSLLMRHRAVLFLVVGLTALVSVWRPELRTAACGILVLSTGSFVLLSVGGAPLRPELRRVFVADVLMVVLAVPALVLQIAG